ncbi:hypothetical protein PoB_001026300 [Plakobranchus ocellatus]|uniref:Uncharacterized protein n=1 Tax=Plakobranchus ocellatus TaxID=259542 RepID=A0AAV3YN31_9GAST|nr:hypothetical protein PoB_001026300 [Plakobranchus ocellatus]
MGVKGEMGVIYNHILKLEIKYSTVAFTETNVEKKKKKKKKKNNNNNNNNNNNRVRDSLGTETLGGISVSQQQQQQQQQQSSRQPGNRNSWRYLSIRVGRTCSRNSCHMQRKEG